MYLLSRSRQPFRSLFLNHSINSEFAPHLYEGKFFIRGMILGRKSQCKRLMSAGYILDFMTLHLGCALDLLISVVCVKISVSLESAICLINNTRSRPI